MASRTGKDIVVGIDNYDDLINENGYYVDKTELLYDLLTGSKKKVSLFTRPRRFGKTLTMSMMESFFDIGKNSSEVFRERNIFLNHPEFCAEWMNQYPTLFVSFKDIEGLTFETALKKLKAVIADLCKKHEYLAKAPEVNVADAEIFQRLMFKNGDIEEVQNSLKTLMRMMYAVYRKPVILLIDEYDVPLAKAAASRNKEFYAQMLDVIRGLMSISVKTNDFLKFSVITGCLRISKESIFTGVNNFACYSVTSMKYSQYFGFTASEVQRLLEAFGMSDKYEVLKKWYDGYIFGNTEVFCPWDVVSYIDSAMEFDGDEIPEPENFWADTSSNTLLNDFINHSEIDASAKFEVLLNGGTITEEITNELTYDSLADSERNLWSVLLMTGYVSSAEKCTRKAVKLRIPNAEIAELFRDAVVRKFEKTLDDSKVDAFVTAMWNEDTVTASEMLSDILWNSISYFDYGEDYYHGMLNGIFTARGFSPDSNDEAGLGRLDLRVKNRPERILLLLEFKRLKKKEDLDSDCDEAIGQILKNGYDRLIPEGYEKQIVYGVAFFGKTARVKILKR